MVQKIDEEQALVPIEVTETEVLGIDKRRFFSRRNRIKIIAGTVCATVLISGGIGLAYTKSNFITQSLSSTTNKAPTQVADAGTPNADVEKPIDKPEPLVDPTYDFSKAPAENTQTEWNGDSYPPVPNDGRYTPSVHNPAGLYVRAITFHEGFRPKGLKALDVEIVGRSAVNGENELVNGRDNIIEVTGTTGKIYNMEGSKGTGVTGNYIYKDYSEYRIIQYADIDEREKDIVEVKFKRNGQIVTLRPDKNTKYNITHGPKKETTVATPTLE
ncbi:hypothetical protein REC12_23035 [Desulfosporosinus sp. PR]|uniref:hypothetical protein n=1 Tax=Candidatus Desulfosporosinus nitrosoreducens TaxID=3401928 RepID=UPI0027F9EB77|nr:hypothetical protein [Desulfosporosinus sp. PR]MDQ7096476.1 hypothetical protein [Desulfosporosinus sp. PR]